MTEHRDEPQPEYPQAEHPEVEHPDDARGSHNRIGYLNVDEGHASSEHGDEEPGVAEDVDQPTGWSPRTSTSRPADTPRGHVAFQPPPAWAGLDRGWTRRAGGT
jgi:hypothetical protein